MHACLRGELKPIDGVTPVAGQREAASGLGVLGARLGVLSGDPANLDHRELTGIGHDDCHGQQHTEFSFDIGGIDAGEGLRAVATLQ